MQKSQNPYRTLSNHLPDKKGTNCTKACLKCAAICDHCASSCAAEEEVKMMSKCIQLDVECTAIFAAHNLLAGSDKEKKSAFRGKRFAQLVAMSVENTILHLVKRC